MGKFWGLAGIAMVGAFSTDAQAVLYGGNPDLGFTIDRPEGDFIDGDVYINKLRIHRCDGSSVDYSVKEWVDPVAGFDVTVAGGDLCAATVFWGSTIEINGAGFEVEATPSTTTAIIDPIKVAYILPWTVTKGAMTGSGPKMYTTID